MDADNNTIEKNPMDSLEPEEIEETKSIVEAHANRSKNSSNTYAWVILVLMGCLTFSSLYLIIGMFSFLLSLPFKIIDLFIALQANDPGGQDKILHSFIWIINLIIIPLFIFGFTLFFSFLALKVFKYYKNRSEEKPPTLSSFLKILFSFPIGFINTVIGIVIAVFILKILLVDPVGLENFLEIMFEDQELMETVSITFIGPLFSGLFTAIFFTTKKSWELQRLTKA